MPPLVINLRSAEDTRDVVHRAVQALAEGQLVAFPTETVYGLGASACHAPAVQRLTEVKGRAADHPFALAIKSAEEAMDYVPEMVPLARRLARRCWPGPITLVVDQSAQQGLTKQLPVQVQNVICPNGTVGLRVPASQILLETLRMLAGPIALTSANRRGEPPAVTAEQVVEAVGSDVDLVLDDGPCRYGQPSSVVRVYDGTFDVLREGVVGESTLRRLSQYIVLMVCTGNTCRSPMAEALMKKHLAKRLGCQPEELEERGVKVVSAGLAAVPGCPPSPEAVQVMKEHELCVRQHESQPLTDQLVRHADLILTMTRSHRAAVLERWPSASYRVQMLLPGEQEVADPIGQPADAYRMCAAEMEKGIVPHAEAIAAELAEQ